MRFPKIVNDCCTTLGARFILSQKKLQRQPWSWMSPFSFRSLKSLYRDEDGKTVRRFYYQKSDENVLQDLRPN
jgi:hypothetical protein